MLLRFASLRYVCRLNIANNALVLDLLFILNKFYAIKELCFSQQYVRECLCVCVCAWLCMRTLGLCHCIVAELST